MADEQRMTLEKLKRMADGPMEGKREAQALGGVALTSGAGSHAMGLLEDMEAKKAKAKAEIMKEAAVRLSKKPGMPSTSEVSRIFSRLRKSKALNAFADEAAKFGKQLKKLGVGLGTLGVATTAVGAAADTPEHGPFGALSRIIISDASEGDHRVLVKHHLLSEAEEELKKQLEEQNRPIESIEDIKRAEQAISP